ncbi:histidine kinase [Streptomyces anthocyanicus]|uniref:histidine kinase n=1 Tax=Streptomyces anthocyanicus TaxID=68174 RepID=UPI0036CEF26E
MHDLVIQRLFAGALSPQPALGRVTGRPKASERIQRVVADLDDTIKVIRSTIHALRESDRQTGTALRSRLVGVTDRAAEVLGFAPALRMTGLLDTPLPAEHGAHLLAVLEVARSNAARHARASAVDVGVDVAGAVTRLRVADNPPRRAGAPSCGGRYRCLRPPPRAELRAAIRCPPRTGQTLAVPDAQGVGLLPPG